jgi:hydrogenase nickel incorporation protein HypA/HybF
MHELSIAFSLVAAACEEAERLGGVRVQALHLRLGPFAGVVKDALLFSFDLAADGTSIAGARLEIEEVPLTAHCAVCGATRAVESPQRLRCATCGTPAADLVDADALRLVALEIADDTADR